MPSFDLLLQGAKLVTAGGVEEADIGVTAGRIVAIGGLSGASALESLSLKGLTILPGVIDTQVHFREPGLEHKEDLSTGTRSAIAGGVTTIFEMPNTKPATDNPQHLADKLARAQGRAWCDFAFFLGATPGNVDHLAEWENLPGCCGIKVFMGSSTGTLLVEEAPVLARIFAQGRRRVALHAEDEMRLRQRRALLGESEHPRRHIEWRDEETALIATSRAIALAREAGRQIHILHVTTAQEAALLATAKDVATMEVTPQHLTLTAPECYERLGTLAQMNPPIRERHHQDALWRALQQGVVDIIGSDHAPHSLAEKARGYPAAPSGMTGVQTLVPVMLTHVAAGKLSLQRFVSLTSHAPQRLFGLTNKGRIAVGYDADFTVVDLAKRQQIDNRWIESRAGWTPFDGFEATGWPIMTIIRGVIVMREGEIIGAPIGEMARFEAGLGR
jgi:dihydroorotase